MDKFSQQNIPPNIITNYKMSKSGITGVKIKSRNISSNFGGSYAPGRISTNNTNIKRAGL